MRRYLYVDFVVIIQHSCCSFKAFVLYYSHSLKIWFLTALNLFCVTIFFVSGTIKCFQKMTNFIENALDICWNEHIFCIAHAHIVDFFLHLATLVLKPSIFTKAHGIILFHLQELISSKFMLRNIFCSSFSVSGVKQGCILSPSLFA